MDKLLPHRFYEEAFNSNGRTSSYKNTSYYLETVESSEQTRMGTEKARGIRGVSEEDFLLWKQILLGSHQNMC